MEDNSGAAVPRAKWAGEAYDFLRLFHDVSRGVVGLALFQVGWAVFVYWMHRAIAVVPPAPAAALEPFGGTGISTLYVSGALFWLAVWLHLSGLSWALARALFANLLRPLVWWYAKPLAFVAGAATIAGDVLFLVIRWPFARIFRRPVYVMTDHAVHSLADALARRRPPDADDLLGRIRALSGEAFPSRRALHGRLGAVLTPAQFASVKPDLALSTFFGWMPLTSWTLARLQSVFSRIISPVQIAFSPLIATTWEEKIAAAAAPARIYAWPVGQLRARLMGSSTLAYLGFTVLPPLLAVENAGQADRRRRRLGLDAIVWGSARSAEHGDIWLHVEQDFRWLPETQARAGEAGLTAARRIEPFPPTLEIRFSSVAVRTGDDLALFVLLLLVLLRTMEIRKQRGWKEEVWGRTMDVSAFDHRLRTHLVDLLVQEVFLRQDAAGPYENEVVEPVDAVLARTVSQWVGSQLVDREELTRTYIAYLEQVVARCADLLPGDVETQYRLAAIHVLLGRETDALAALTRACALEVPAPELRDVYMLDAMARMLFDELTGLDWEQQPTGVFTVPEYWAEVMALHDPFTPEPLAVLPIEERRWAEFVVLATRVVAQRYPETTLRLARMAHEAAPYASMFEFRSRHLATPALALVQRVVEAVHPDLELPSHRTTGMAPQLDGNVRAADTSG